MFTQMDNPPSGDSVAADADPPPRARRGRPPGRTSQGEEMRKRLYDVALELMSEQGYEGTTLREIAARAKVSPGLLYRYFPGKRSIVLVLYENLSARFASEVELPNATWRTRFVRALKASLAVLAPHRETLRELIPVLVSTSDDGLFSPATAFSRERVAGVFSRAVMEARDTPRASLARPLGHLLYLLHLAVILVWLLDRSPQERATRALVRLIEKSLPIAAPILRLPGIPRLLSTTDELLREALVGPESPPGARRFPSRE